MISVLITSGSRHPVDRKKIRETVREFIKKIGLRDAEVSILIVGSRKARELNRLYRKIDQPTSVLSFPLEETRGQDGILRLGDIVICYALARQQAAKEEKMVDVKVDELLIHGLKHLVGEHHEENF